MKQKYLKPIISIFIFFIGIIILLNSITLSQNNITHIMAANGGSMDTNIYLIYLEQSISTYKFLGIVLMLIGGFGVIMNKSLLE